MSEEHEILVVGSINVAGYGIIPRREAVTREAFRLFPASLIGFQELADESMHLFRQHNHTFIKGEQAGNFYNSIAYDPNLYEVVESGTIWLSEDGRPVKSWDAISVRNATWAFLRTKQGSDLLFVNTQFDNVSAQARHESMRIVLSFLEQYESVPLHIFSGDFNMSINVDDEAHWPKEKKQPYYMALEAGYADAYVEAEPKRPRERTFHSFQGPYTCGDDPYGLVDPDIVFVRGFEKVLNCMTDRFTAGGTFASDHLWLVTDLLVR
jgi:endonuclease/exonuclease/phosphatase family metal-dependent hydrolase